MTNILTEPYSTFSKRLDDWLRESGGEVVNLTLDLINRAQDWLWVHRDWDELVTRLELTVTNKAATMPADFGRVVRVGHDADGDGLMDYFYYAYGRVDDGYYWKNDFTKAAGHVRSLVFYRDPTHAPTLEYVRALDHFEGSGTEYSFFPPDLVVRTAQKIHIGEADIGKNEYGIIVQEHAELLRQYERTHMHRNRDMRNIVLDNEGDEIDTEQYNLGGDGDHWNDVYSNSYDSGLS